MIQFDCHAHVYETAAAMAGARYTPKAPAPLADWLAHQKDHGLTGGVIVQVSFLGTDNSELCKALSKLESHRFAGVAVVALDVGDAELDHLVSCGVRGLRWNLVRGSAIPSLGAPETQAFLTRLRERNLHLELHLEGSRLAPLLAGLTDQGLNVVIDHFGLPTEPDAKADPMLHAVKTLSSTKNLFFKFSAMYRTAFDIQPHAQELLSVLAPDRVIWGSDWPHTQHESHVSYEVAFQGAQSWCGLNDTNAAQMLYGLRV